jgi:hypothetical protein
MFIQMPPQKNCQIKQKTVLNGPVGQKWTQWTFGVIENKIVHPVYQVHLVYKMPVPNHYELCHKPTKSFRASGSNR